MAGQCQPLKQHSTITIAAEGGEDPFNTVTKHSTKTELRENLQIEMWINLHF